MLLALTLAATIFAGHGYAYYAVDWTPADGPRPAPRAVSVELACPHDSDPQECFTKAWSDLLKPYRETPLTASPGGRSYRLFSLGGYFLTSGPSMYRLDVSPSGTGRLRMVSLEAYKDRNRTERYAERTVPVTAGQVKAFEVGLAASDFGVDPKADGMFHVCTDGTNETLEAVTAQGYRWVVEPCGGEAKLEKALKVMWDLNREPW